MKSDLCIQHWMITDDTNIDRPSEDPNIRGDALKTLFVGRLSYDTKEQDLEREFGRFGPIERVGNSVDLARCALLLICSRL